MMEEEVGIKVTRLRRRLSVESDDVKSPSTPLTPTKKRGGRLAAKPQLELIDENATETVPKQTRKTTVKEAEPVEEKVVTPSRRSTRIRSNTSILSETPEVAEEKTADKGTPSRRSTRIKSNSSLIAETVNVNSPRAKRAARRTSLAGSDNEAPATPVRQTRRTRKTSTSSVDNQAEPVAGKLGGQLSETIAEETDAQGPNKDTKPSASPKTETTPVRKSPRLGGKSNRKSSLENEDKENEPQSDKTESDKNLSITETKIDQTNEAADDNSNEKFNLSISTTNLINQIDEVPKKGKVIMNKSTTSMDEPAIKSKRNRTKSWTTISVEPSNDHSFCSDSEASKKKIKENKTLNLNMSGSGDGIMNKSSKDHDVTLNTSVSNKKNKKRNEQSMSMDTEKSVHEISLNSSKQLNKSTAQISEYKEISQQNDIENSGNATANKQESITEKLFKQAPTGQASIFIEDSDSNNGSIIKENKEDQDGGDQCVPVVDHKLDIETSNETKNNMSYEPMDIDETMPENTSLSTFTQQNNSITQDKETETDKRKSVFDISEVNDSLNKSKRKSKISVNSEDVPTEDVNKSQRKSSITSTSDFEDKDSNKSKRKSKILDNSDATRNEDGNKSRRKSSITSTSDFDDINKESNKSKRKSSISKMASDSEDVVDGRSNTSNCKSLIDNDVSMDKKTKKSKRKSMSVTESEDNVEDDVIKSTDVGINTDSQDTANRSSRKSSISKLEEMDVSLKQSKKSSVTAMVAEVSINKKNGSISEILYDKNDSIDSTSNKSKRKSSTSFVEAQALDNTDNENKSTLVLSQIKDTTDNEMDVDSNSNKSKNKSAILKTANVSTDSKFNKSKRKSSVSFTEAEPLDKTENENKSTLLLSQIKDNKNNDIDSESNVPKTNDINEQLSKSVDVPNEAKESDKKNLSLTYSTSTPLQQKSFKKLGLQINSSIITPNSASKVEKKNTPNKSKKEASVLSQKDSSDSSEEETDEEESMDNSNKLVIDEAEEASDDYESGDSMDEEEREYQKQNEIVEKGETLDSDEEDYSDDSDYEKDSFIVSSDNEDDELLSGSGDDLAMSDNELSMSAKSKKKFNERKLKEQKKASREMFEARHKLNETDKSAKSNKKKNNRQRLESTSGSDDEDIAQPKKSRRQRIDSSQDISNVQSEPDESITKKKKKKVKRLSESVCESNEVNEKEMTIMEETNADKVDPLNLKDVIKVEPKTPQKDLNISTVAIPTNVEEVNVDENVSIMKSNQTSDPLQETTAQDDDDEHEDQDSISENEEITQNYESLLKDLNKSHSKKIKTADISLNLDKKAKKSTEPIVDQLNLTQIKDKKSKKNKKNASEKVFESKKNKSVNKISTEKGHGKNIDQMSESSSDSIDMKLLFPEDSNDSEAVSAKANESRKKPEENIASQDGAESFIPLKRTEGKTNILESTDSANTSLKDKKNKRKSKEADNNQTMDDHMFFVDTTGTLAEESNKPDANTSIKNSAKKNKQKNNVSFANIDEVIAEDDSNDAPLEVSYCSDKNKSKQDHSTQINEDEQTKKNNTETPSQSGKRNKKNKKNLNSSQNMLEISTVESTDDVKEKSINISTANISGSGKKKKRMSESQMDPETETGVSVKSNRNVSLSSTKKKTVSESSTAEKGSVDKDDKDVVNNEEVPKKRKRKSSANQTIEDLITEDDIKPSAFTAITESVPTTSQKKKRKISHNDEDTQIQVTIVETQEKVAVQSVKKKNKEPQVQEANEINEEPTKKNKKRKEREDDDAIKMPKVLKQNSSDKIHVPRLPANLLKQLDDKPNTVRAVTNKPNVVSTTSFVVEETRKRRNKPSNYLEQSVYLNDDFEENKPKSSIKNPKVLPFVPTASTSDKGFTTKFTVNVIPRETVFIAQSTDISNFKNDYLHKNRIKKLGTFEMYKRQRKSKISKF